MKLLASVFILFISYNLTLAQWEIGVRTGVLFAKQRYIYKGLPPSEKIIGLDIGGIVRYNLYKGIYTQQELSFIQKGGNKSLLFDTVKVKNNQIETASLLGYKLSYKKLYIYANTGLFFGRVISRPENASDIEKNTPNFSNVNESWDWGFVYGGGLGISLEHMSLFIGYRYRGSFNDANKINIGSDFDSIDIILKNKAWGGYIGFTTTLKER